MPERAETLVYGTIEFRSLIQIPGSLAEGGSEAGKLSSNPSSKLFSRQIEDNAYARSWKTLGEELPTPTAILCISAHWMTRGSTLVHIGSHPKTIHDFGGFPAELFAQQYPVPGAPEVAQAAIEIARSTHLHPDTEWGLDHGAWSVLIRMFPKADIPVFQLSLDLTMPLSSHSLLGRSSS